LRGWRWILAAGLLLCLLMPMSAAGSEAFDPFLAAGIDSTRIGGRLPRDLQFTDQQGRAVTLGSLLDARPMLLVPVYYRCPNVCGAALSTLFSQLDTLAYRLGRDYQVIAFSFDPREGQDAAAQELDKLARHWPGLQGEQGLHLLTSDGATSAALAGALGFGYRFDEAAQQYAHSSAVAVITRDGKLSRWLYGLGYQASDVRLALTEAGQGKLGSIGEQLLLLCYHYDPRNGTYSSRIIELLQVAGVATVAAMALFIVGSLRREKRRPRGDAP
jgi:protein SCO1/2